MCYIAQCLRKIRKCAERVAFLLCLLFKSISDTPIILANSIILSLSSCDRNLSFLDSWLSIVARQTYQPIVFLLSEWIHLPFALFVFVLFLLELSPTVTSLFAIWKGMAFYCLFQFPVFRDRLKYCSICNCVQSYIAV